MGLRAQCQLGPLSLATPDPGARWGPLARTAHLSVLVWWPQRHLRQGTKPEEGQILLPKHKMPHIK